ncbi:MAG TPA: hypothetical protein VIL46_00460, partial [Gemmataceae bacterium]
VQEGQRHLPVTFVGPPSRLRKLREMLQNDEVRLEQTVEVPEEFLQQDRYVRRISFDASRVPVPPGVRVVLSPNAERFTVVARRVIEKELQVQFNHTAGAAVEKVTIEPGVVRVRGLKEVLDRTDVIPTQLYKVPEAPNQTEPVVVDEPVELPLVTELRDTAVEATPSRVRVRYTLRPQQRIHGLDKVPIRFLCPADFPYRARFLKNRDGLRNFYVQGPWNAPPPAVTAFIDLTNRKLEPGVYADEPLRVQLPDGFRLIAAPEPEPFELVPAK